jgi:transposase
MLAFACRCAARILPHGGGMKSSLSREAVESIITRVKARERHARIAADFGISRQYVGMIYKDYKRRKALGLPMEAKLGRAKARLLNEEQLAQLRETLATRRPSQCGLRVKGRWTMALVHKLVRRIFRTPVPTPQLRRLIKDHALPVEDPGIASNPAIDFDPEYFDYIKSPLAAQIREREEEWRRYEEQRQAQGLGKRRRGRPPLDPSQAAQKGEKSSGPKPDDDDDEFKKLESMSLEELEAKVAEMRAQCPDYTPLQAQTDAPGQDSGRRTGKHAKSKGSPFTKSKKRRRR